MNDRIEPTIDPTAEPAPPPAAVPRKPVAASAPERAALDQFSRMEDKLARMEEKFSRTENMLARAQDGLDRAAARVEIAAKGVDAAELASEVAGLRARLEKAPRLGGLIIASLVTALATTILLIAILKFAPGLLK